MSSAFASHLSWYSGTARVPSGWRFWLPAALTLLAVVVPDFQTVNVLQAAGENLDSNLLASMSVENSFRELLFMLVLLALGGVGAWLLWGSRPASQRRASWPAGLMLATAAVGLASCLWSDAPEVTLRRLVIAGLFAFGCWGMGAAWRPMHLVWLVLGLSATFAGVGLAAELAYGTFGGSGGYRFSGFLHPNQQALSCGLLLLAAITLKTWTGQPAWWLVAAMALGLLWLTGSRGGLLASLAAVGFYLVLSTPPRQRVAWWLLGGLSLGSGLLYLALQPAGGRSLEALARMGRSDPLSDPKSLTGRIPIWEQIVADISQRPTLGYGYAGYWTAERVHRLSYIHDWEFNNAHSSYLEMLLALGAVGFSLGLASLLAIFAWGLRLYAETSDPGLLFVLSVFVMGFVSGLVESSFVSVGYELIVWLTGAFLIVYYPTSKSPRGMGEPVACLP